MATGRRPRLAVSLLGIATVVTACVGVPASASLDDSRTTAVASPPGDSSSPSPVNVSTPAPASRCPARPLDPLASLGPEFATDVFLRDESRVIAEDFLAGLAAFYARPDAIDPCEYFTDTGWTSALEIDPRLRSVEQDGLAIAERHVLRLAYEGVYDLRDRPPRIPIDAIFDIPAGATRIERRTGTLVQTSTAVERVGMHLDFVFDGERWRVDRVGPISAENERWADLPDPVPPGPPCAGFVRDAPGARFDDRADRPWCTDDGQGRTIRQPEQLTMLTRYPCDVGQAAIVSLGQPLGATIDPLVRWEYVRDPAGAFLSQGWIEEPFAAGAELPADAASSGWTNGSIELWISPSEVERAIYLVRGETVERWPRARPMWGVTDCN